MVNRTHTDSSFPISTVGVVEVGWFHETNCGINVWFRLTPSLTKLLIGWPKPYLAPCFHFSLVNETFSPEGRVRTVEQLLLPIISTLCFCSVHCEVVLAVLWLFHFLLSLLNAVRARQRMKCFRAWWRTMKILSFLLTSSFRLRTYFQTRGNIMAMQLQNFKMNNKKQIQLSYKRKFGGRKTDSRFFESRGDGNQDDDVKPRLNLEIFFVSRSLFIGFKILILRTEWDSIGWIDKSPKLFVTGSSSTRELPQLDRFQVPCFISYSVWWADNFNCGSWETKEERIFFATPLGRPTEPFNDNWFLLLVTDMIKLGGW